MQISVRTETARTVGELIKALEKFDKDMPIECGMERSVQVTQFADYDTKEPTVVEINGMEEDEVTE